MKCSDMHTSTTVKYLEKKFKKIVRKPKLQYSCDTAVLVYCNMPGNPTARAGRCSRRGQQQPVQVASTAASQQQQQQHERGLARAAYAQGAAASSSLKEAHGWLAAARVASSCQTSHYRSYWDFVTASIFRAIPLCQSHVLMWEPSAGSDCFQPNAVVRALLVAASRSKRKRVLSADSQSSS